MNPLRALALAAAAFALTLLACGPKCTSPKESEQLYFKGKCGPDATISASVDDRCNVVLSGAAQAGLPEQGTLNGTGSRPAGALLKDGVNFFDTDGGVLSCSGRPADGGLTVVCHQPCPDVDAGDNCDLLCDGFFFTSAP